MIGLLGPFRLHTADGRPVDTGGPRVRMLVARLALDANRTVPSEVLIGEMWGAGQPPATLNALQSLVSRARRVLAAVEDVALESGSAGYRLSITADSVDVHRFERLATQGSRHLVSGDVDAASRSYREALGLWRGEMLIDFPTASFTETYRAKLGERRLTALEGRIEADLRSGRDADLVAELDALVTDHPLRERFTALRMRALCGSGRQADALAAYDGLRRRLSDELGLDPSAELRELHVAVLRGSLAPPTRTGPDAAEVPPRPEPSLPLRMSSFVGRETEIDQLAAALRDSRLVTLFGPGGAGKTRLATESAAVTGSLRVVFVELAPVRDAHDLASAVLAVLGPREARLLEVQTAAMPSMPRLVEALSSEPTLLVLDNCEHVIDAAAGLVSDLVARCAELRVLTTSREPLALTGETLLPVGPLTLPDGRDDPARAAAVRLFAERARAVRPAFTIDSDSIDDVAEICRGLDGMPLAIELAAARLRSMSVRQVADRLNDRFRLLTGGNRTSMPRHRTLRAVVEWSWDLLTEPERLLAARLSVFTGSVRAESIAEVCAGVGLPHGDVVYVLSSLVEKSLVEAVDGDAGMRYRMLETVRAYCAERLDEAGESAATRTSHAAHFVEFAESAGPRLLQADQLPWLERLDREHDNVLTALHWSTASGDADGAFRLVAALGWYWAVKAPYSEVVTRLDELAELPGEVSEQARAVVDLLRGFFGHDEQWADHVRRSAARVRDTDAMRTYLYVALVEPIAWMQVGDLAEMRVSVQRALELPDPWAHAAGLFAYAAGAEHRGDLHTGESYARAAAEEFGKIGDLWAHAQTISMLAGLLSTRGDHTSAVEVLAESVDSLRYARSTVDLAPQLWRTGMERIRAGDLDGARIDLREAATMVTRSFPYTRISVACGLVEVARYSGDLVEARDHLRQARQALSDSERVPQPMRQMVLAFEARLLIDEAGRDGGGFERAWECLATAFDIGRSIRDMPLTALLVDQVARLLFIEGEPERAARMLGAGKAMRGVLDEGEPDIRTLRADLEVALGSQSYRASLDGGAELTRDAARSELARVLDR